MAGTAGGQARMKEEERQKKQAEFKEKTQAILDQQQAEIAAKMRELEEAEKERKRVLEQQRLQQQQEAEEKRKVRAVRGLILGWSI